MCTSIHINFSCVYSLEQKLFWPHSNLFQANLDALQSLKIYQVFSPLLESPPPLTLATLAFPPMFIPGIMSVFYLTQLVFLVYILDMIKQHKTNLSAEKINILFGIPQYIEQYGYNNLQNVIKLYNHFLFLVKNIYSVMVLIC